MTSYMHEWQLSQIRVECGGCHMFAWGSETIEGIDGMRYHPEHLPLVRKKEAPVFRLVSSEETVAAQVESFFALQRAA